MASCQSDLPVKGNLVLRGYSGSRTTSIWNLGTPRQEPQKAERTRRKAGIVNVHYWHTSVTNEGLGLHMHKQEAECSHLCLIMGELKVCSFH